MSKHACTFNVQATVWFQLPIAGQNIGVGFGVTDGIEVLVMVDVKECETDVDRTTEDSRKFEEASMFSCVELGESIINEERFSVDEGGMLEEEEGMILVELKNSAVDVSRAESVMVEGVLLKSGVIDVAKEVSVEEEATQAEYETG